MGAPYHYLVEMNSFNLLHLVVVGSKNVLFLLMLARPCAHVQHLVMLALVPPHPAPFQYLIQHPTQSCLIYLCLEVVGSTSTIQYYQPSTSFGTSSGTLSGTSSSTLSAPNPKLFDVFVLRGGRENQHHTALSSTSSGTSSNPKLFDVFVLGGGGDHQHHTSLSSIHQAFIWHWCWIVPDGCQTSAGWCWTTSTIHRYPAFIKHLSDIGAGLIQHWCQMVLDSAGRVHLSRSRPVPSRLRGTSTT